MNREAIREALANVPLRIENPELIPAKRYYDAAFFELEREKLWPHIWQMACRLEEIPDVGDYAVYDLFEKSVIVARTKDGIRAYHNVCRHRGMRLVGASGNCKGRGFICPFHGWRYDVSGRNTYVFGRDVFSSELLEHEKIDLRPVRVEVWGGCAFINFDNAAPSLLESLGPNTAKLDARNAEKLRTEWWYASEVPINWKVAIEAFQEMYHLMRTHPQMHSLTPTAFGAGDGLTPNRKVSGKEAVAQAIEYFTSVSEGMASVIHARELEVLESLRDIEVPDDAVEATTVFLDRARAKIRADYRARGIETYDLNAVATEHPSQANEFFFPNFFLLPMFGCMASYRIRPMTPQTCLFEIWSLIPVPDGDNYKSPKSPTVLAHDDPSYPEIVRQDYSNMPMQQRGLASGAIEFQRLSASHEGCISNWQRLIDGYLAGLDPALLVRAQHVVNGGSFLPIRDIGF